MFKNGTSFVYLRSSHDQALMAELLTLLPQRHACRMTAEASGERVLSLGASDFVLLVLAGLAVFYVLPKMVYRYASGVASKPDAKRD